MTNGDPVTRIAVGEDHLSVVDVERPTIAAGCHRLRKRRCNGACSVIISTWIPGVSAAQFALD